jgi:ketosteroid isomerase-like protein
MKTIAALALALLASATVHAQAADETLIRRARIASNAAISAHNVNGIAESMEDSIVVTRGSGAVLTGIADVKKSFADGFALQKDLVYIRTTTRVDVSTSAPLAAEHGMWVGRWTGADGKPATANGTYLVMWRKTLGVPDGLPDWKIRSELYVTLGCTNCK